MDPVVNGIFIRSREMLAESPDGAFEAASATDDRRTIMPTSAGKRSAEMSTTLTMRVIGALEPTDTSWIAWDDKLTGFGV